MSSLKSQFLILRPPSSGFHPLRLMGQSLRINPEGSNASKPTLRVLAELACSSPAPHPSLTSVQNKNSARVWGTPRRWVTPAPQPQHLFVHSRLSRRCSQCKATSNSNCSLWKSGIVKMFHPQSRPRCCLFSVLCLSLSRVIKSDSRAGF